jgi:tagatose-1,6-bisphosphate aldolase non-catalytic subunit AgaZ/GatZ
MIRKKFDRLIANRCTVLGVGPMSVNCVDATIELANEYETELMLIASRRQIDSDDFGGGYVNNWSTKHFSDYVIEHDKKGKIVLARDHGGPWQNPLEIENDLSLRQAMDSAKSSYASDIDAGFQILHIDPSVDIHGKPSVDEVLDRVFELYEYCWNYAQKSGKKVLFEIGTEEQSGSTNKQEELGYTLNEIQLFCRNNKMDFPLFVVMQTGTRVMETKNIGSFDQNIRVANEIPSEIQIPKMVELCRRYNIYMKVHNTDYLTDDGLKWYPRLGLHAANVAPEFGVVETRALLEVLDNNDMHGLADRFLEISYNSGKWKKWMIKGTSATDKDKSIISGHYVFSRPECMELLAEAADKLSASGINLNSYLKDQVKASILRYMTNFRVIS